jgi:hypothetical protein
MKKVILSLILLVLISNITLAFTKDDYNQDLAFYSRMETTSVTDETGNFTPTNHGTSTTTGFDGNALDFDGSDTIDINHLVIPDGIQKLTINYWGDDTGLSAKFVYCRQNSVPAEGQNGVYIYKSGASSETRVRTNGAYETAYFSDVGSGDFNMWTLVVNTTHLAMYANGTRIGLDSLADSNGLELTSYGVFELGGSCGSATYTGTMDEFAVWHKDLSPSQILDLYENGRVYDSGFWGYSEGSYPNILSYNLTSDGGCTSLPTGSCQTSDSTPTIVIDTENANFCAIGKESWNYTQYEDEFATVDRSCVQLGSEFVCTLTAEDEISYENSLVYISCRGSTGFETQSGESTSGPLQINIPTANLETSARDTIDLGVSGVLSDYTIYTDQKVYARNAANEQKIGIFDKVVKWANKIWIFNYLTGNDSSKDFINVTPTLYYLELSNLTTVEINDTVKTLINLTI